MFLIDTHTHLYDAVFEPDIDQVIGNAREAGIHHMLMPNCDIHTLGPMNALAHRYPGVLYTMAGLHPCYVKEDYLSQLDHIRSSFDQQDYIAVGEVGLDYYWDKAYIDEQKRAFDIQIGWALDKQLPVVIHTRDSIDDGIAMIARRQSGHLSGVFHCFSGTEDQARKIIDKGFRLGIGGVLTFKNSGLKDVLKVIGIENIIIETDAPYLAPVPHRGKRNEPAYVRIIAECLSTIYQLSVEEIAAVTSKTAEELFNINSSGKNI